MTEEDDNPGNEAQAALAGPGGAGGHPGSSDCASVPQRQPLQEPASLSLISASLGRPVRLSSVELRLLPRPGFVLTDLTVEEDPAYGAEPVLHANTVTASIRLLSLWRGRLEIDTISVDEASLNLVRTAAGRWNLDSLLRTATAQAQSPRRAAPARQARPAALP